MKSVYIVGIDEVGRGSIAGPVAVGAFICEPNFFDNIEIKTPLRDSKKLSAKQRGEWFTYLQKSKKEGKCNYAVSYVSSDNIDKFGIVKCIQKALDKSLEKVITLAHESFYKKNIIDIANLDIVNFSRFTLKGSDTDKNLQYQDLLKVTKIFLDGGLKAPKEYTNQKTIIKGDELHPVISCASIVAKVSRDAIMKKYAQQYPDYGFENHVGYGTSAHYDAIKKKGLTVIHRKTFINLK